VEGTRRMNDLPIRAKNRLASLREELANATSLKNATVARVSDTFKALRNNPEGPQSEDVKFELQRLETVQRVAMEKYEALSHLVANLDKWVQMNTRPLADAKAARIKERSGLTWFDRIHSTRTEIAKCALELREVEKAELPLDELRAQVTKWVMEHARRATPRITASHREGFKVEFGQLQNFDSMRFGSPSDRGIVEPIMFHCLFHPKAVIERLYEQLSDRPTPDLVLSPADRDKQLTKLKDDLIRLERTEEQLVAEAEATYGHYVERRREANPMAVLGLAFEQRAAAETKVA
jgi:hypothetical protein